MFLNILFILSALLTLSGAIAVVFTKNIMHACVYLLACLLGMAGLYITLDADFIAAIQLVVYVGGVVILMVFAVMLTGGVNDGKVNRFGIEKIPTMGNIKTYVIGVASSIVVGLSLYTLISKALKPTMTEGFQKVTAHDIGVKLVTDHVLPFEVSSVLLLGALIGAAIIARPKKSVMFDETTKHESQES